MNIKFEWDYDKAINNYQKHGVKFEEAMSVFEDNFSLTVIDDFHSIGEERFIDIGLSNKNSILIVVYTENKNKIRIISSRKASKKEIKYYENKA